MFIRTLLYRILFLTAVAGLPLLTVNSSAWAQNTAIRLSDPLRPDQIILLYNPAEAGTRELAAYYTEHRGVPSANICPVSLALGDDLSREKYEQEVVPLVKGFVQKRMREGLRVRALLSLYGMPLRINGPQTSPAWRAKAAEMLQVLQAVSQEQDRDIRLLETLADPAQMPPASQPVTLNVAPVRFDNFEEWVHRYQTAAQRALLRIQNTKDPGSQAELEKEFLTVVRRSEGVARLLGSLHVRNPASSQGIQELEKAREKLATSEKDLQQLLTEPPYADSRARAFPMLKELGGNLSLIRQLLEDRTLLNGEQQRASLEGELSVILWPKDYSPVRWLPNPLQVGIPETNLIKSPRNTLLAVRLDGPDLATVYKRLDDALETERVGLAGTVYLDARGIKPGSAYGEYDQNLRDLAGFLQAHGRLKVVLDDRPEVFPPGACPDAAVYCGWYSLGKYVDSFVWNKGAVGYHIASAEAVRIRGTGPLWVQMMLQHGVVATLGPVDEPYLASFPLPGRFFPLLLSGRLTYAEVYYATSPMLKWMQTPVGDPLYRPFAVKPAVEWSALEKAWPQVKELSAPTTRPAGP